MSAAVPRLFSEPFASTATASVQEELEELYGRVVDAVEGSLAASQIVLPCGVAVTPQGRVVTAVAMAPDSVRAWRLNLRETLGRQCTPEPCAAMALVLPVAVDGALVVRVELQHRSGTTLTVVIPTVTRGGHIRVRLDQALVTDLAAGQPE